MDRSSNTTHNTTAIMAPDISRFTKDLSFWLWVGYREFRSVSRPIKADTFKIIRHEGLVAVGLQDVTANQLDMLYDQIYRKAGHIKGGQYFYYVESVWKATLGFTTTLGPGLALQAFRTDPGSGFDNVQAFSAAMLLEAQVTDANIDCYTDTDGFSPLAFPPTQTLIIDEEVRKDLTKRAARRRAPSETIGRPTNTDVGLQHTSRYHHLTPINPFLPNSFVTGNGATQTTNGLEPSNYYTLHEPRMPVTEAEDWPHFNEVCFDEQMPHLRGGDTQASEELHQETDYNAGLSVFPCDVPESDEGDVDGSSYAYSHQPFASTAEAALPPNPNMDNLNLTFRSITLSTPLPLPNPKCYGDCTWHPSMRLVMYLLATHFNPNHFSPTHRRLAFNHIFHDHLLACGVQNASVTGKNYASQWSGHKTQPNWQRVLQNEPAGRESSEEERQERVLLLLDLEEALEAVRGEVEGLERRFRKKEDEGRVKSRTTGVGEGLSKEEMKKKRAGKQAEKRKAQREQASNGGSA